MELAPAWPSAGRDSTSLNAAVAEAARGHHLPLVAANNVLTLTPDQSALQRTLTSMRTLVPLDVATILASVERTSRVVVAHEAVAHGGFGAEVAAQVQAAAFDFLDAPIARVGAPFAPIPFSGPLEDAYLPGADEIVAAVRGLR